MDEYIKGYIGGDSPLYKHWKIIVAGAESNLRKVKTLLNDLQLRWATIQNISQAKYVDFDLFVGWEVLMRSSLKFRARLYAIKPVSALDFEKILALINDAYRWADGDDKARARFKDDVNDQMRRVLIEIKPLQPRFTRQTLEELFYMSNPPQDLSVISTDSSNVDTKAENRDVPVYSTEDTITKFLTQSEHIFSTSEPLQIVDHPKPSRDGALIIGDMEFMRIPKGIFLMGSQRNEWFREEDMNEYSDEIPQHKVDIPYDYWLARFTVTNNQFYSFTKVSGRNHPVSDWEQKKNYPVIKVCWLDAKDYIKWLNENVSIPVDGLVFRLPSEAEWEKAARGVHGNIYPWGNDFEPGRCNSLENKLRDLVPVDAYPEGASIYGCEQMVGNVWEWTNSLYRAYPYNVDDGREMGTDILRKKKLINNRVLRGGAYDQNWRVVRSAYRGWQEADTAKGVDSFRIVLGPPITKRTRR